MVHGFSGVKELLDHQAALFSESGFSVPLYDHRSFGAYDGLPGNEVNPRRRADPEGQRTQRVPVAWRRRSGRGSHVEASRIEWCD
jgi:hypothetical protein